jgi:hypothetical protein
MHGVATTAWNNGKAPGVPPPQLTINSHRTKYRWPLRLVLGGILCGGPALALAEGLYRAQSMAFAPVAYFGLDETSPQTPPADLAHPPPEALGEPASYQNFRPENLGVAGPCPHDRGTSGWTGFSRTNSAARFPGVGSPPPLLVIPPRPELDFARGAPDAFTITLWVRGSPTVNTNATILYRAGGQTNVQVSLTVGERGLLHVRCDRDDGLPRTLPPWGWDLPVGFLNGDWQHVAIVLTSEGKRGGNNGLLLFYVNARRVWYAFTHNQGHTSVIESQAPFILGGIPPGTPPGTAAPEPFQGEIDELAFYNRALSEDNVRLLFDAAQKPPEPTVIILGDANPAPNSNPGRFDQPGPRMQHCTMARLEL